MNFFLHDIYYGGTKQVTINGERVNIKVKPGMREGQILRMKGKGNPGSGGGENGDLLITVHVAKDPIFERRGDDLHFEQSMDVLTAVLGGKVSVKGYDKTVSMDIPPGTDSNKVFRLKGLGLPVFENPEKHGDAYVRMVITVPKKLSDEETKLFSQLAALQKEK